MGKRSTLLLSLQWFQWLLIILNDTQFLDVHINNTMRFLIFGGLKIVINAEKNM